MVQKTQNKLNMVHSLFIIFVSLELCNFIWSLFLPLSFSFGRVHCCPGNPQAVDSPRKMRANSEYFQAHHHHVDYTTSILYILFPIHTYISTYTIAIADHVHTNTSFVSLCQPLCIYFTPQTFFFLYTHTIFFLKVFGITTSRLAHI